MARGASLRPPPSGLGAAPLLALCAVAGSFFLAGCAASVAPSPTTPATASLATTPPSPDPRIGLQAGALDSAASAFWNLRLVSFTPRSEKFVGKTNSDLAFHGKFVIQGGSNGFQVWNIANPAKPVLTTGYVCPASQGDVSVYQNLLFVSAEGMDGRLDCGTQGITGQGDEKQRLRGIRIFDIRDVANPKYVANVQTCRGSHTHTVLEDPNDRDNIYIYVSGSASVRAPEELPGCSSLTPDQDPNSALFRIEVIKVPVARPEQAAIVSSPRIFTGMTGEPHRERPGDVPSSRPGPDQCHDITVYPAIGLAGGACEGYGLLLDIRDPANPKRLAAAADSNFAYWHSATFNNDGTKILFSDEWGGGFGANCGDTHRREWGANAIFTLADDRMMFHSYYKIPSIQTATENCVAHNGSLIPVPGRDLMVQAWYQGGITVFDWTDPKAPKEIAFFDRGPMDAAKLTIGGTWSAYWYNGYIISSEMKRGLDILELTPSGLLSQNEIDAAKLVQVDFMNAQGQAKVIWPASFVVARAYVDQLARSNHLPAGRIVEVRTKLADAEQASGGARRDALTQLAGQLDTEAATSSDPAKVRMLTAVMGKLAEASK